MATSIRLPSRSRSSSLMLVLALVAGMAGLGATSPFVPGATAGPTDTYYVDGKSGSDANLGTSREKAFKTVKAGMWALRWGGTLNIVGYDDHVYREAYDSQWYINGTSTKPVVIQAYGYGTSGYVRPILSGSRVVSRPGDGVWTRPDAAKYPNVWQRTWGHAIPGYESNVRDFRQERVFVGVSEPLIRPKVTPTLADLQANPGSQYWNGTKLYVRLGGWGTPSGASLDPNTRTIEIPTYKGVLVSSGSAYVHVKGLRIRHTTMGVGFTGDSHHNLAQDVDASYNYTMGFWTGGKNHTFRGITGTRNTLQLVKLDNGAQNNLIEDAVAIENMGQGIKLTGSSNAYNTIRNSVFRGGRDVPKSHGQYGGFVQGIDIEQGAHDNTIEGNTIERNRRGLMLYQITPSGGTLKGNKIRHNVFLDNDDAVVLWDGKYNATQGSGSITFTRNVYAGNGKAVIAEGPTSNKIFDHETIHGTGSSAAVADSAFYMKAGSVKVRDSIITDTAGHAFYTVTGSKVEVSTTIVRGTGLAARNSTTRVVYGSGMSTVDPMYMSVDAGSAAFVKIGSWSPAYTMSSTGGPIGARWASSTEPPDTTAPTGTVKINGGAASTRVASVRLAVPATDASGVAKVRIANSGGLTNGQLTNGTTFDHASSFVWTLPPGSGNRTVHVQWRDHPGNWSAVATASIALATPDATYVSITPVRLLDTRANNPSGITKLTADKPKTFTLAGRGGIPANAVAITANLTVTGQTKAGYVTLGPIVGATPASSTLNFPVGDNRANGLFVPLADDGSLEAVYKAAAGASTHLILDVTGYFLDGTAQARYHPVTPARFLDTRTDDPAGPRPLSRGVPRKVTVAGRTVGGMSIPAGALALTGNLTVTGQTASGYLSLTPTSVASPSTSTLNFPKGDTRANNVTVPLGPDGAVYVVYQGGSGSAHAILDVTGYFTKGSGGLTYVPLAPARIMDSRIDLGAAGTFSQGSPKGFMIRDRGGVASGAGAFTGNLTVTSQKRAGYGSLTPMSTSAPSTSTLNFPVSDNRANGVASPIDPSTGRAFAVYMASSSATTHFVLDVTGYFH